MALTDFWEVKDNQILNGKPILNVYHAKRILAGANAGTVGRAFIDSVIDNELASIQTDRLTRTNVEVANLGDVTDFASLNSAAFPGTIVGQSLPSFNAATIQFNRSRTDMKNGMKRFMAGTELEQDDGDWVAGFQTLLATLAGAIVTPWQEDVSPGIDVCDFVILKRFCVVPAQDPCLQYRLPNTDAEADNNFYNPSNATVRSRVRSQVSRKVLI